MTAPGATNDHYALDLTRNESGGGAGKAVLSVASGVVRVAGWARRGWAPYGKLVYVEHDFRDRQGRKFQSLYAHLDSVSVRPGQRVPAGARLGTLGGSSRGRRGRFGPHLHFAMYVGARPTLGGGRALVPEPMGEYEDLHRGMVMTACAKPAEPVVTLVPGEDWAFGGLFDPPAPR